MFYQPAGGGNGQSYTDRGDPDENDFVTGDFIKDFTWRDLNLSGIIGTGIKLVHLQIRTATTTTHKYCGFRPKGNVNVFNQISTYTHTANWAEDADGWVMCNATGIIQYRAAAATWGILDVVVKGWLS